jgi:WD40 repeat protein
VTWPDGDIECRRTIQEHKTGVTSIATFQGEFFTGAYDGCIKVFNADSGKLVKDIQAHSLSVWSIAIHEQSRQFFSAGSDGQIKVNNNMQIRLSFLIINTDYISFFHIRFGL